MPHRQGEYSGPMSDLHQPELFSQGPAAPVDAAPQAASTAELAARIPPEIRLGTSSWTFPGWEGVVYDREAPPATLASHGLGAYARHPLLRCVAVDRTYYSPLGPEVFRRYAAQVPGGFRFVVKADRRLLFPDGPGSEPELFLNAQWATHEVVGPVTEGLGPALGALLFQFPPIPPDRLGGPRAFAERLYRFLSDLPPSSSYIVEIRSPGLLTPDYREALRHGGARHGYVVHPEMPDLPEQARRIPPDPVRVNLIRWMLQPGLRYAQAREAWAPFRRLAGPDPERRNQVAELALAASQGGGALVVVNNKAEGSAPLSIHELAGSLARLAVQRSESS